MFKSALLALLIVLAAPAAVSAQPSAASAELQDKINGEMKIVSQRMQPVMTMQQDTMKLLLDLIDRADQAVTLADKHASRAEVSRWVATWEPEFRAKAKVLHGQLDAVKPMTAQEVPSIVSLGALQGTNPDVLLGGPAKGRDLGIAVLATAEDLATSIKEGAGGNERARRKLARSMFLGPMTLVRTEATMLEFSRAGLPKSHPQHALFGAMMESDLSLIEFFQGLVAEVDEKPMDAKLIGGRMLERIAAGRILARDCDRLTIDFLDSMAKDPNTDSPFGRKVAGAMATFKDSAAAEEDIFAILERIARKLQAGESLIDVSASLEDFDAAVDRRSALQRNRLQLIGQ